MSEEDELTEEEKKKMECKAKIIFDVKGNPLICLDEPVMPKKVMQFFPFNALMEQKQNGMKHVIDEMRKRFAIPPNQMLPFDGFDIFIIDLRKPKKEEEDDCESE